MTRTVTARAIAVLFSEFPLVSSYEKYGFSLVHTQRLHSQSPCANQNIDATACYVCGDWLLCQTISVHNNPARLEYWFVCNSGGHIGSGDGTLKSVVGPRSCSLVR